jgi:hypothetical protein
VYLDPITDSAEHGNNGQTPVSGKRSIFREEAFQHYIANEEKVELPMVVSPRFFVFLWIVSLLLMVVGLVIAFWPLIQQWLENWT